ncbi:hypothetical protein GTY75_05210 [Streptomyces sp. SID8381]|uniref:hypothetical protein n=1 Tax=unclassified Streptomyces TaxID=2593676 RepID=UPI00037F9AFB|nr:MULTISPECIES: hypothetical protein [unclassified Streptomyces]MYX26072.1 hypothetical protein [Streptomyces sp. SID8381]
MIDTFWKMVDAQLNELKKAKTADDVIKILGETREGEAFFAGGSGDDVMGALFGAGWSLEWAEADYYWLMKAPDGSQITYIEGDVYRGDKR